SDRRRNRLQGASAAWADIQPRVGPLQMSAHPMPARCAILINTLHGPARQILHVASPSGRSRQNCRLPLARSRQDAGLSFDFAVVSRTNHTRYRGAVSDVWISCETSVIAQ